MVIERVQCAFTLLLCAAMGWAADPEPLVQTPEIGQSVAAQPAVRRVETISAGDAAGANAFELVLEAAPESMARAFLVFELAGVPHWTAVVRAINGLPAQGGFGAVTSSGVALQMEEINPRWLRPGVNQIVFAPAPASDGRAPLRITSLATRAGPVPYTVRNLRLVYIAGPVEPGPRLQLSHPVNGESDEHGAILRGFVDPAFHAGAPAELFVNESYLPQAIHPADGSFAVFVPRSARDDEPWEARLEVVYRDGTRLRRTIAFSGNQQNDDEDDEDGAELDADGASDDSLTGGDARLELTAGALGKRVKLTMRGLRKDQLAALDAGMTNVTPQQRGFRFGPHGLKFNKPVRLRLPYDPALLPKGMTIDDIRTFYFDEVAGRWFPLPRAEIDEGASPAIVSATDHFTDFINATLVLPEDPGLTTHFPNSLAELSKTDPATEIIQIDPPEGGATGDAMLSFPIVIPPGRRGMHPALTVDYNSAVGNGWLGVGWDLRIPVIEISTLFGVPIYDGTERYLINGEQLALAPGASTSASETAYVRRIEDGFDRILRKGGGPANYWWEVTDKNGTRHIYGHAAQARLKDPQSGNVFRWYLERSIDLHGNTIDYFYFTDQRDAGAPCEVPQAFSFSEPFAEVYPDRIDYTGVNGSGGHYSIKFNRDGCNRPDRISSGRPGFMTYMRYRLANVEVRAGQTLVRRYDFAYTEGDFRKSLLQSIAVFGEGAATEFYRHTFDYTRMPSERGGYSGFSASQAWGGIDPDDDFSASTRTGFGLHSFIGVGSPAACLPHGGAQFGGTESGSSQSVMFFDVNGDGLPDRLHADGTVDLNRFDPLSGLTTGSFLSSQRYPGTDTLVKTRESGLDFSLGIHPEGVTASVDVAWSWTHANDDHIVTDINGDLRPDLVSTDNGFRVRRNTGASFLGEGWGGFSGAGLQLANAEEEDEVMTAFRMADPLRALVVPYSGQVTITGAIRKKEAIGDGVTITIYRNSTPIWARLFFGDNTAPCVPAPSNACGNGLSINVSAGDDLYFVANARRDTSGDELEWAPVVSYADRDADVLEPYGAPEFVFDAAADFTLAGYDGASWVAGATGMVKVTGAFTKQQTSDDVTVTIGKRPKLVDDLGFPIDIPVFEQTFAASEETTFSNFGTFPVGTGDLVILRVTSRTPIDPRRIQWPATVEFVGETNPPDLPSSLAGGVAQIATRGVSWSGTEPLRRWTPPAATEQTLKVSCNANRAGRLYVQGVNRLFARRDVAEGTSEHEIKFTPGNTDPVFVTHVSANGLPAGNCTAKDGADAVVPVNGRWQDVRSESLNLTGGYHGWRYGEWNGSLPGFFSESNLRPPEPPEDEDDPPPDPNTVPGAPRIEGTEEVQEPVWIGSGFDFFISANAVKPSRRGGNASGILDSASGMSGGLSILRKTDTRTTAVSAGVSGGVGPIGVGASLTLSWGKSESVLDLLDMNGDRFPDQVSESGVRFSNGRDGFGSLRPIPGLSDFVRRIEDGNVSVSFGLGIMVARRNGKGKPIGVSAQLPTIGDTVTISHVDSDLIDVNGDGLPDRVSMRPGNTEAAVQLNFGHRFGMPEMWALPPMSESGRCSDVVNYVSDQLGEIVHLDTINGLNFTRSSTLSAGVMYGPFGGSASTTLSRTLVELLDVNGDALPDRVAKDHNEDFFRVQINLGDRWDTERRWYVPNWPSSVGLGDGYNPANVFKCLDAVSFSGNIDGNLSGGFPICIPLLVIGIQFEFSAQAFQNFGQGVQLFMDDIDGDGLADHILKKDDDGNVYVRRNQAAGVNLLKSVERPLGSTIEIGYQRRGNTVDHPFSHWAIHTVKVKDPHSHTTATTTYDYGNDLLYDRDERDAYGYGGVTITRPDNSKVVRTFLNDDFYTRHLQTKEVFKDFHNKLFRVATKRYEQRQTGTYARFNALVETRTDFYEGTTETEGAPPNSKIQTYAYDAHGNVTSLIDSGDAGDADNVVATVAYQFDSATHLTRPVTIEVRDGAGRLLRKRTGMFNAAGDLLRHEQTLIGGRDPNSGAAYSGTNNSVSTFAYDALGNRTSTTDPNGLTTIVTYDPATQTYPHTSTEQQFGYVTTTTYDLRYGKPADTIDPNGNTVRQTYDAFGRLASVVGPYDSDDDPALAFQYNRGNGIAWAVVKHKDVTRPNDSIDSATFIDSLGRVIQTKDEADVDDGNTTRTGMRVSGAVTFDILGRVIAEGQPVFNTDPVEQFVAVTMKKPTRFTYDAVDRVRTVTFPHDNAVTQVVYDFAAFENAQRFRTTRTDPKGRVTRFYRDTDGNVLGVQQTANSGRRTITTRYAYDALEQLVKVTDAQGKETHLEYDTLGNRILVHNPDLGRVEMRYDPAGNLRAKITANLAAANQQVRYVYTFGRLERVDYPQSPDVVYTYGGPGAPFNRATRIATVADESGVEERSYGKLGELVETVKQVKALNDAPAASFRTRMAHDEFGRLLSVTYPDGDVVTYGYDAGGKVKSARGTLMGQPFDYLRHMGYDEFGDRVRTVYGNGVDTRFTHDPSSRFLTDVETTLANRPLQKYRYTYDNTGTLLSLQNNAPASNRAGPVTQTFQYDDLVQLTGAQGTYNTNSGPNKTSKYTLTLGYDDAGNVASKNQLHETGNGNKLGTEKKTTYNWSYAYGARPHAPVRIADRTFTYDLNGNQTGWTIESSSTSRALTWNEDNRLTTVSDNGRKTRFLYDANGIRTNKAGQHGESIYVNASVTVRNGAVTSKHIFADDVRIATKVTPDPAPPFEKVYFFTSDHLGSANYITDETGALYQHLEYFPTGEIWVDDRSDTQKTPQLFSGKELDEETGLSYFGFRYYDARQGQWISADPVLDEMLDADRLDEADLTQSPFRLGGLPYSYVGNAPVDLVDPWGLVPKRTRMEMEGRIEAIEQDLDVPGAKRLKTVQATVTRDDLFAGTKTNKGTQTKVKADAKADFPTANPQPKYDAGHPIAYRLGGPGNNKKIIFAQKPNINRGRFSRHEEKVAALVEDFGEVFIDVTLFYEDEETPGAAHTKRVPNRVVYFTRWVDNNGIVHDWTKEFGN